MDAKEILAKLRVRPGFQLTTYVVRRHPLVCVDFLYEKETSRFAVAVSWPLNRRIVYLHADEVGSKSAEAWNADKTYHLTENAINRLAPSLTSRLNAIKKALSK